MFDEQAFDLIHEIQVSFEEDEEERTTSYHEESDDGLGTDDEASYQLGLVFPEKRRDYLMGRQIMLLKKEVESLKRRNEELEQKIDQKQVKRAKYDL
jgi:FtsZ-binding cell division protein ZapB